jgi:hypothetical protein
LKAGFVELTCYGGKLHPELAIKDAKRNILTTRSGNVSVNDWDTPRKRAGRIACKRNLRQNHLLPNADVILCSADYGLKHVLGNLLEQSYESIFQGDEYRKIENSLCDESSDTLCRYCDSFCGYVNFRAKLVNTLQDLSSLRVGAVPVYLRAKARRLLYKIRYLMGIPR